MANNCSLKGSAASGIIQGHKSILTGVKDNQGLPGKRLPGST